MKECKCPPGNWCGDVLYEGGVCKICQYHDPHDHESIGKYAGRIIREGRDGTSDKP